MITMNPVSHFANHELGRARSGIHNYSGMTRLTKLDFPRFNGERIKEWIGKAEQFFAMENTPEELKVGLSSRHFDGLAATWHQSVIQSDIIKTMVLNWPNYKMLLQERFEELLDDPMAELRQME